MKKLLLFTAISLLTTASFAQKKPHPTKQQKITAKYQSQQVKSADKYQDEINKANEETTKKTEKDIDNFKGTPPKRVQSAFMREYPQATDISWAKKGDIFIVSFNYGTRRQTASYHSDGKRIYTRRVVTTRSE